MPGVAQPNYDSVRRQQQPDARDGRSRSTASRRTTRSSGSTASRRSISSSSRFRPTARVSRRSKRSASSPTASTPIRGWPAAPSVNVQVKSGTNTLAGSLFEHVTDYRMKSKNFFLPAGDPKGTGSVHVYGGTVGGPISRNKVFFFASVERTRQRTEAGNALSNSGANGLRSLPTMAMREGNFAGTGTVLYDPRTGAANGTGRVPFAFAELSGLTRLSGSASSTACNYIPANRINPIAKNYPQQAGGARRCRDSRTTTSRPTATTPTTTSTTARSPGRRTRASSSTDGSDTPTATRTARRSCRRSTAAIEPDLPGTHLGLDGPQPLAGGHLHAVADDGDGRRVRVHAHRHAGASAHGRLLGRAARRQEQLSAAAIAQHGDSVRSPRIDLPAGWRRRAARLSRSAVERRDELRVDEGRSQRQVRRRDEDPPSEPLRDADADRSRSTAAGRRSRRPAPNNFNAFADFLLGEAELAHLGIDDADDRRRADGREHRWTSGRRRCGRTSTASTSATSSS